MSDWNTGIVQEFRENAGKVGGMFEGAPMLILHHTGARSGTIRQNPLMYQAVDGGYAIFASKAGADTNPDWYHNLKANPETKIEVGADTVDVTARFTEGEERDTIWSQQKSSYPQFAEYEEGTSRVIPVVVLEAR